MSSPTPKSELVTVGLTDKQLEAVAGIDTELVRKGQEVIARQKEETFRQAWRTHWRAGLWSVVLTLALFMEGYDTGLLNSFYGMPQFRDKFGIVYDGETIIPSDYQAGLQNITRVGQLIGLVITGYCQERFGSKKTYIAAMFGMTCTIFLAVFAINLPMLLGAELAMGIPWGMFQTLATAYAAEICPIKLRGYLAALASLGWGGGGFLGAGVLRACLGLESQWAWRLPFAIQWVFPVPLGIIACWAPESPWWLVRQGRLADAEKSVLSIAAKDFYGPGEIEGFVAFMRHTNELEKLEAAKGSWVEMFKGTNRRRTEIMLGVWLVQNWNGSQITGLAVQFLRQAGLSPTAAFNISLITEALGVVGVGISWIMLSYMGRRPIYLTGIVTEAFCLLPIGIIGCISNPNDAMLNTLGAMLTLINFIFHFSLGPVCYSIAGEIPSSRLRSRTIVLGRAFYLVSTIITQQLNVRMVNVDAWNWRAKSGFFWLGTNLLCLCWSFFRLPETAGFSFADLEILFANKVSTRRFKSTKIHDDSLDVDGDLDQKQDAEHIEMSDDSAQKGVMDTPARTQQQVAYSLP